MTDDEVEAERKRWELMAAAKRAFALPSDPSKEHGPRPLSRRPRMADDLRERVLRAMCHSNCPSAGAGSSGECEAKCTAPLSHLESELGGYADAALSAHLAWAREREVAKRLQDAAPHVVTQRDLYLEAAATIAALEARVERLLDALGELHDEQNGPPLIRREKQWQAAMDKAVAALKEQP